jgi:uncharacterized protein YgbK (DUF1537 family)
MRLGAIADDVTGGTDLAAALRRAGCRVVQTLDVPTRPLPDVDAVVVSLKIRSAPVPVAVDGARRAAAFLTDAGAARLYYKYCSTFDSTDDGNIGPVVEALLGESQAPYTVACPSYPALGRTVYQGHLFVGATLLSESSMRDHPVTPMTDPNLVRVLARQTSLPVGLASLPDVERGAGCVRGRLEALCDEGIRVAIVDAIFDRHVDAIAEACRELPLATGGAALGAALGRSAARQSEGAVEAQDAAARPPIAILSGSCSSATISQVDSVRASLPTWTLDPLAISADPAQLDGVIAQASDAVRRGSVLVASTADPSRVSQAQQRLGRGVAAALLEAAFGRIAIALAVAGVRTFVVAGGETSGAVLQALGIHVLEFGGEIDPGVPWVYSVDPEGFRFALKSGNFGSPQFFARALGMTT